MARARRHRQQEKLIRRRVFSNEFQRRNAAFLTLLAPNFPAKLLVAEQMTR
jgi:hypothetical protein